MTNAGCPCREAWAAILVGRGPGSVHRRAASAYRRQKGLARGASVPLMGDFDARRLRMVCVAAQGTRGQARCGGCHARRGVSCSVRRWTMSGRRTPVQSAERVVRAAAAAEEGGRARRCGELQLTGDGLVRYGALFERRRAHGARACLASCGGPAVRGLCCSAPPRAPGEPYRRGQLRTPRPVLPGVHAPFRCRGERAPPAGPKREREHGACTGVADEARGTPFAGSSHGRGGCRGHGRARRVECFEGCGARALERPLFLAELDRTPPQRARS
ncbi:MAG: hypothetical protein ACLTSX_11000 [Collinsella sp.]